MPSRGRPFSAEALLRTGGKHRPGGRDGEDKGLRKATRSLSVKTPPVCFGFWEGSAGV